MYTHKYMYIHTCSNKNRKIIKILYNKLKQAQKSVHKSAFSEGWCQHRPREVLFSSHDLGKIGILFLHIHQELHVVRPI